MADLIKAARNLLAIAALIYILAASGLASAIVSSAPNGVRYIGQTRVTSAMPKEPAPVAPKPETSLQWELFTWFPVALMGLVVLGALGWIAKTFFVDSYVNIRAGSDPKYMIAATVAKGKQPSKAVVDLFSGVTEERRQYEKARTENQRKQAQWRETKLNEYQQKLLTADSESVQEIEIPGVDIHQAVSMSKPHAWIMGQITAHQPRNTANSVPLKQREFSVYDFRRSGHIGILGGTGSGKTESSGMLAVYCARRFGLHVIMLDGKEGLDWGIYDGSIEWHSMTADSLHWQIMGVHEIYRKRVEHCLASGVNSVYALPKPLRPILLVMEEFGDTWEELKRTDKGAYDEVAGAMDTLFRKARAMGIVLCLIDQAPQNWSKQMRGNTKFVICYKLKGGTANAFNEYFVDQMTDFGQFSQGNTFYVPWHTANDLDMMSMPRQDRRLLAPPTGNAPRERSEPVPAIGNEDRPRQSTVNSEVPTPLARAFMRYQQTGKWEPYAEKYFKIYPDHKAAQLAKAMAAHVNDGREWRNFYSVAHGLHKQIVKAE